MCSWISLARRRCEYSPSAKLSPLRAHDSISNPGSGGPSQLGTRSARPPDARWMSWRATPSGSSGAASVRIDPLISQRCTAVVRGGPPHVAPGGQCDPSGHRIAVDQRLLKLCLRRIACVYHQWAPGNQAFGYALMCPFLRFDQLAFGSVDHT
jgi:hypothetical protein